jgi:hypothetical protein
MKTCTNCKYKISLATNSIGKIQPEFCLRYPPTTHLVVQQDKFGQQMGTTNTYPAVNDQTPACGEFTDAEKLLA